jgi:xylan 1,4-beta-xylosidase
VLPDARGASAGESEPLCIMPRDEAYQVEAELELEGDARAGLLLFATPELHVGLELAPDGQLRRISPGMKNYAWAKDIAHSSRPIALRITNRHEDVTLAYRGPAGAWHTLTPAYAIDRMGESLAGVRAALFVHGSGRARFYSFTYEPLPP